MVAENEVQQPQLLESPKWVRVFLGGQAVADSRNVLLLRGEGQIPVYYFPQDDVRMQFLGEAEQGSTIARQRPGPWPDPPEGAKVFTVRVDNASARNSAWLVQNPPQELPDLAGHIAFVWNKMEAWYEELVEDIVWSYPFPNHQYAEIQNLIAFPQEGVDAFEVDGGR